MVGQVVIAYKEDKTEAAETQALTKAVIALTGADTTVDAIEASRKADFAWRKSVWDECVEAGKCKASD